MREHVRSGFATLSWGTGILILSGLLTSVITARAMSLEERGTLLAILLFSGLFGWLSTAGIEDSIVSESRGSVLVARSLIHSTRGRSLKWATVCAAVAAIVGWLVTQSYTSHVSRLVIAGLVFVLVILTYASQRQLVLFRVDQKFQIWNFARLIPPLIYLIALSVFAVMGTLTVLNSLLILVGGGLLLVLSLWFMKQSIYGDFYPSEPTPETSGVEALGLKFTVSGLANWFQSRADQVLIVSVLGVISLSVFSVALAFANPILALGSTVSAFLLPKLAPLTHSQRHALLNRYTLHMMWMSTILAILGAVTAFYFLTDIYGDDYSEALYPAMVIMASNLAMNVAGPSTIYLQVSGNSTAVVYIRWISALVYLAVLLFGLQVSGLLGAALALLFATCFYAVIVISLAQRRANRTRLFL
jgi:O-antigen/teichoic acid export membrane protein